MHPHLHTSPRVRVTDACFPIRNIYHSECYVQRQTSPAWIPRAGHSLQSAYPTLDAVRSTSPANHTTSLPTCCTVPMALPISRSAEGSPRSGLLRRRSGDPSRADVRPSQPAHDGDRMRGTVGIVYTDCDPRSVTERKSLDGTIVKGIGEDVFANPVMLQMLWTRSSDGCWRGHWLWRAELTREYRGALDLIPGDIRHPYPLTGQIELPAELVRLILDNSIRDYALASNPSSLAHLFWQISCWESGVDLPHLASLARVCRHWNTIFTPTLYRIIPVYSRFNDPERTPFRDIRASVRHHVKSLVIAKLPCPPVVGFQLLRHFPNATQLLCIDVSPRTIDCHPLAFRRLAAACQVSPSPNLSHIALVVGGPMRLYDVVRIIAALPSLRRADLISGAKFAAANAARMSTWSVLPTKLHVINVLPKICDPSFDCSDWTPLLTLTWMWPRSLDVSQSKPSATIPNLSSDTWRRSVFPSVDALRNCQDFDKVTLSSVRFNRSSFPNNCTYTFRRHCWPRNVTHDGWLVDRGARDAFA